MELVDKQKILPYRWSEKAKKKLTEEEKNYWEHWEDKIQTIFRLKPDNKIWANRLHKGAVILSLVDAPDPDITPHIVDILKEHKIRASFSVIGTYLDDNEAILKRIYA